jgi:hypothetical protein
MANYKQSNLTGQEYQRCYAVSISNPLDATKQMGFAEEKIYVFDQTTINKQVAGCAVKYDPTATFPIIDPVTGNPTGETATQAQIYQMIYSLYIQTATARDAQQG